MIIYHQFPYVTWEIDLLDFYSVSDSRTDIDINGMQEIQNSNTRQSWFHIQHSDKVSHMNISLKRQGKIENMKLHQNLF